MDPKISAHFKARSPSAIRLAQITFKERQDAVLGINTAIGNVSLPTHPLMQKRLFALSAPESPFRDGVIKYSATVGERETNEAFLNIIASSGFSTDRLYSQITNGGSQAMELMILGTCGPAGSGENPLLLIDAAYTNYTAMASRLGRRTVSVTRILGEDGKFSLPSIAEIEEVVEREKPHAMVVIPYDNPTGHFYDMKTLKDLARICVRHDMWMISDEAYRELFYVDAEASSIWGITNSDVPGIEGRRISIETTSKVWNACGLRIGALITDSEGFHEKAVAENTADLCSSVIGQYIFGALAHESHENLKKWYEKQRSYYCEMMIRLTKEFHTILPGVIISSPDASIYSVVDVRNVVKPGFDAQEFVLYCAKKGKVSIDGEEVTLLVAPMAGFYSVGEGEANPGKTQMRIAYVETPENMAKVSKLFVELLHQYEESV